MSVLWNIDHELPDRSQQCWCLSKQMKVKLDLQLHSQLCLHLSVCKRLHLVYAASSDGPWDIFIKTRENTVLHWISFQTRRVYVSDSPGSVKGLFVDPLAWVNASLSRNQTHNLILYEATVLTTAAASCPACLFHHIYTACVCSASKHLLLQA